MADKVVLTDAHHRWMVDTLGLDPRKYSSQPHQTAPKQAGGRPAAPAPDKEPATGPAFNPFEAPEARIEIEKLTLPKVRDLAVEQAQNARADFATAIAKVRKAKMAKADQDKADRELMWTIVITVALMPAGPLIDAAANAIVGKELRNKLGEVIANNAGQIEAKFGPRGGKIAGKAFDFVASDAVGNLADKFDSATAKKALERGKDALKDKAVKFLASPDEGKCIDNYLDAMEKAANDAMHNLTNVILSTKNFSEAVAFYNLFAMPLQASYEAELAQQVDDMMSELSEALAQHGQPQTVGATEYSSTTSLDEIVRVNFHGRKLLAHVRQVKVAAPFTSVNDLVFVKWVTPDMEAQAARMAKQEVTAEAFGKQRIPDPQRESGERVVRVDYRGKERLMLIDIEDVGIFWRENSVPKFKQWAESEEDEQAFRSRGALQIGGVDKIPLKEVRGIPK